MGYTDTDHESRDENQGSIITSLISQLRFAGVESTRASRSTPLLHFQSRHGPLQGDIPDVCARASQHARTYHGLHVPPGPHLWVRVFLMSLPECPKTRFLSVSFACRRDRPFAPLPPTMSSDSTSVIAIRVHPARRIAQNPKNDLFACCSTISRDGTSNQRVSRNRASSCLSTTRGGKC